MTLFCIPGITQCIRCIHVIIRPLLTSFVSKYPKFGRIFIVIIFFGQIDGRLENPYLMVLDNAFSEYDVYF